MSIENLSTIGENLRTQDNRHISEPAFCVQVIERLWPIMLEYDFGEICFHNHEQRETYYHDGFDPERWSELKKLYDEDALPSEYLASHYIEKWITIQTCFTEAGCKRYLELNGHNLRHYHGTRIYVESFRHNQEMIDIRNALISQ